MGDNNTGKPGMDWRLIPLYFVIGGLVVSVVTYLGSQGKGPLAAFVALLPSVTVVTLVTIYLHSGMPAALSYVKNLLKLFPPWLLYAVLLVVLLPRIGLVGSLLISTAAYLATALLIMRLL